MEVTHCEKYLQECHTWQAATDTAFYQSKVNMRGLYVSSLSSVFCVSAQPGYSMHVPSCQARLKASHSHQQCTRNLKPKH